MSVSTIYRRTGGAAGEPGRRMTAAEWEGAAGQAGVLLAVLLAPACVAYEGWVLQRLWGWFVAPAAGIAAPSLVVCIGLTVLAAFLLPSTARPRGEEPPHPLLVLGRAAGKATFYLVLGWVVNRCA